jgi:hypothetical protein
MTLRTVHQRPPFIDCGRWIVQALDPQGADVTLVSPTR